MVHKTEAELIEETREAGREFLAKNPGAFGGGIDPQTGVRFVNGGRVSVPGSAESEAEIKRIQSLRSAEQKATLLRKLKIQQERETAKREIQRQKKVRAKLTREERLSLSAREQLRLAAIARGRGFSLSEAARFLKQRGGSVLALRSATKKGFRIIRQDVKVIETPTLTKKQFIDRAISKIDPKDIRGTGKFTTAIDVGGGKMQDFVFTFVSGNVVKTNALGTPIPQTEKFIDRDTKQDEKNLEIIQDEIKNIIELETVTPKDEKEKKGLIKKIQDKLDDFFGGETKRSIKLKNKFKRFLGKEGVAFTPDPKGVQVFTTPTGLKQLSNLGAEIFLRGGELLSAGIEKLFRPITPEARLLFEARPKADRKAIRSFVGDIFLFSVFTPFIRTATAKKGSAQAKIVEKKVKKIDIKKIEKLRDLRKELRVASETKLKKFIKKSIDDVNKNPNLSPSQRKEILKNLELFIREARGDIIVKQNNQIFAVGVPKPIGEIRVTSIVRKPSIKIEVPEIVELKQIDKLLSAIRVIDKQPSRTTTSTRRRKKLTGKVKQLIDQLVRQVQRTKQKQKQLQKLKTKQAVEQRQAQKQKLKLMLKKIPKLKQKFKKLIKIPKIKLKKKIKIPFLIFKRKKRKRKKAKKKVKDISYNVSAKPVKKKRLIRVNKVPLRKSRAEDLRNYIIDTSLSRTGKIKRRKRGKPIKPVLKFPKGYAKRTSKKFRKHRTIKGKRKPLPKGKVIEKRKNLLDTIQEIRKISLRRRIKQITPKKKIVRRKIKRRVIRRITKRIVRRKITKIIIKKNQNQPRKISPAMRQVLLRRLVKARAEKARLASLRRTQTSAQRTKLRRKISII